MHCICVWVNSSNYVYNNLPFNYDMICYWLFIDIISYYFDPCSSFNWPYVLLLYSGSDYYCFATLRWFNMNFIWLMGTRLTLCLYRCIAFMIWVERMILSSIAFFVAICSLLLLDRIMNFILSMGLCTRLNC